MKFKLSEDVFGSSVTIYWGDDRFFSDTGQDIEDYADPAGLFTQMANRTNAKIWICGGMDNISTIGTLAHELLHFTFKIAEDVGIEPSNDSEEFYTYIHKYYLEKAIKKMKLLAI